MRASFVLALLLSCVGLGARGEVRWVDTALDESGDGTTPETAFATLEDTVYAAGAGDEIRILGGAHRTVELGATTNGLVLAQEGLRLVGWGSVPPTLLADEDVPRSRGEALVHLAGANQVVSNLCFRFSDAGAGEAAVIAVEAPCATVADCDFALTDGPAGYHRGGGTGLVACLRFVAAHAMTGDARYLDAAFLANDYHCGCNPNGATWTSGLGREYPVGFLSLVSCSDGIGEYVEGITPYRNTYGLPQRAKEYVWNNDADEVRLWPFLRRWANVESQTVATSEYTVWETIGPAAAATGYLMGPGLSPPVAPRTPAADVRDLPGYWSLP